MTLVLGPELASGSQQPAASPPSPLLSQPAAQEGEKPEKQPRSRSHKQHARTPAIRLRQDSTYISVSRSHNGDIGDQAAPKFYVERLPETSDQQESVGALIEESTERAEAGVMFWCKVCDRSFGRWVSFRRHCKTCEIHPGQLYFCARCHRSCARQDSCVRHVDTQADLGKCTPLSPQDASDKGGE
ncbi:hypothetical protein BC834DRAFT_911993 [Gloeopeniophorella convolvens]|nr:hypothetical protein BC834DRAFT_911993 [Gloeopeniophorella convolvens]